MSSCWVYIDELKTLAVWQTEWASETNGYNTYLRTSNTLVEAKRPGRPLVQLGHQQPWVGIWPWTQC